jgi:glycosyltransferase involved in cell wall biosynthesis
MRIGIDGRALTGRFTGDRTYWRSLLRALLRIDRENAYVIYSRIPIEAGELPDAPNLMFRVVEAPNERLWTLSALPRAAREDACDLLHVQYTTPPRAPCPVVTTVHDISFRLHPEWFPLRHRLLLNLTVPPSMRRAARVITDSESSRQDMLRTYNLPESKIVTTPLGLSEGFPMPEENAMLDRAEQEKARQFAKERYGVEGDFLLAVGVLQPRKNLSMLAEAFGQARAKFGVPHRLVLIGKSGWGEGEAALRQAAERGGGAEAAQSVQFTGYVEDADLSRMYRASAAFAYPSLYEGFGLPPLEAMACGTPVLVSDAPAMPEVVGDAARIVPARDIAAWCDALGAVFLDAGLREVLIERGYRRARQFRWERTASLTLQVYEEASGAGR